MDRYEANHPHWKVEVLVSFIKWSIKSLKHYVEDDRDKEVTWANPFVELRHPVQWDWQTSLQIQAGNGGITKHADRCPTCGWRHDPAFTQLVIPGQGPLTLAGLLPDIVRCVHRAHEKGFARLSTKDEEMLRTCGGYSHPSKAFYDLGQSEAYRLIFDTSRRGFIALRGFASRT